MNAYELVGVTCRQRLRASQESKNLTTLARNLQRSCETLDLTAVGIANNIRDDKFGEAQLRCDAAERAAEELLASAQLLSIRVRDARLARSSAA